MKKYLLVFSLFFALPMVPQKNEINCPKPLHAMTSEDKFNSDVRNNTLNVYIVGGMVSVIREREVAFAKKYNVRFHDFGCVVPANLSFYDTYNQFVFKHLTNTFGPEWLKEINPNVIGITKYKEI